MTMCRDLDEPRVSSLRVRRNSEPSITTPRLLSLRVRRNSEPNITTQPLSAEQCSASLALKFTPNCRSAKSVRFDESGSRLSPGQYSPYTPKSSPRSILKYTEPPSLSDEQVPTVAANAAVNGIVRDLITSVKNFKQPTKLDFSGTPEDAPLVLAKNDQNRPFIDQLYKLGRLRNELAEIATRGDSKLEGKHRAASEAIERAIERMKDHQLMLYNKSGDLHNWFGGLKELVDTFSYSPQLDFLAKAENNLALLRTERNTPFIIQLKNLAQHRAHLHQMYNQSNQKHNDQWQIASDEIEQTIQHMKEHHLKLRKKHFIAVLDNLRENLSACVKNFKQPSELDFSGTPGDAPLVLAKNDQNRPFIDQLCKLGRLRNELAEIPTHGDSKLEGKHRAVGEAIERAIERMKEHQIMLYNKSGDLDMWFESLKEMVDTFSYPPQLDFLAKGENNLTLLRTERNTPFIIQLKNLAEHRAHLRQMYSQSNQKHNGQWQIASDAIERAMQDMRDHQLKLWKRNCAATLDSLLKDLNACVQAFEYPSKLNFPPNAESGKLVLLDTKNNKTFIKQFRALAQFRDQLCAIKTDEDEQLENKHKAVGTAIVKSLQKLQKHHRECQEEHIKARK